MSCQEGKKLVLGTQLSVVKKVTTSKLRFIATLGKVEFIKVHIHYIQIQPNLITIPASLA